MVIHENLALRRPRQKDLKFETSLGYIARPYFKKNISWGCGSCGRATS
jgi:hypothetical protein